MDQSAEGREDAYRSLSKQKRVAVDTLRAILRARGDSEKAVDMAAELAAERFHQQRVYGGTLLAHGLAPYEHKPEEKLNYFVTIKTIAGDRTIWGVDLERAIGAGGITAGDDMALVYRGRKSVTITDQVRAPDGQSTQKLTKDVNRNSWKPASSTNCEAKRWSASAQRRKQTNTPSPWSPSMTCPRVNRGRAWTRSARRSSP